MNVEDGNVPSPQFCRFLLIIQGYSKIALSAVPCPRDCTVSNKDSLSVLFLRGFLDNRRLCLLKSVAVC